MAGKKAISTDDAPTPAGPYSQGIVAKGFLYTAGFGPHDPKVGKITATTVGDQTRQVMRNIATVLATHGLTFADVVKTTAHLADLHRDFQEFNGAYEEFLETPYPVRTTVGSTLGKDMLVEIDVVAALRE